MDARATAETIIATIVQDFVAAPSEWFAHLGADELPIEDLCKLVAEEILSVFADNNLTIVFKRN